MTSYRIETFDKVSGAYQGVEVLHSREEMIIFCTEPWRRESLHVVYALSPHALHVPIHAVFVDGRCVLPLLNDNYRRGASDG